MIKLDVPYFVQNEGLNCGPTSLRIALAYLGKDYGLEILEEKTGKKEGKGISTLQIATAAASLGYKTEFYSKHVLFNEENLQHDFYKKYASTDLVQQSKKLVERARQEGVIIEEKELALEQVLEKVTLNSIPIILLDWNIVNDERDKGYKGHFVPLVGYDEKNVYVHNPGLREQTKPKQFMDIPREIFDEARKAAGTDEDVVIIYRK